MSLEPGDRLGPFEITAAVGAGGMGEVYRAQDSRLGRRVAIKVLPEALAADPALRLRLEQEARAISALSHPNICVLYDVGAEDGVDFLVMEYLEGETLAERLARGALPLSEALEVASPIASALAAAHRKGIVHRDLKPGNVMLTRDGVKLLDFGLARTTAPGPASDLSSSPTLSRGLTVEGAVLGTFQYMAPEQLEGREADPRSDLFAFGATLYEMLTAEKAFRGESQASLIAAIMDRHPVPLGERSARVPELLQRLVERCLAKQPEERWASADDLVFVLEDVRDGLGRTDSQPGEAQRAPSTWWKWAALGATAAAVLLAAASVVEEPAPRAGPASFEQLTRADGREVQPTISPDGRFVAYASAGGGNEDLDIHLLRIGGGNPIRLTASSSADDYQPAFSPDGDRIAFRSDRDGGGIFVMGATGESARRLTDFGYSPSWAPDGEHLVIATESVTEDPNNRNLSDSELWVVELSSGQVAKIGAADAVQPAWSPNGRRIAFWGVHEGTGQRDIWTVAADGSDKVPVTSDPDLDWNPVWSPDGRFLWFSSQRGGTFNLWRVAIDEATGEPESLPEPITAPARWAGQLTISRDGRSVVYTALDRRKNVERVGFDPARGAVVGTPEPITRGANLYGVAIPSPDGEWLLLETQEQEDILLLRLADGELRQLTAGRFKDRGPVWDPDGKTVTFFSDRSGKYELWSIATDGSDLSQLTETEGWTTDQAWSPDGSRLAATSPGATVIFVPGPGPLFAEAESWPVPEGAAFFASSWSPDGAILAGVRTFGSSSYGLALLDVASGSYRTLLPDLDVLDADWLGDGRRLLLVSSVGIHLLDVESGDDRLLLPSRAGVSPWSAALSADHRFLYVVQAENEADLWVARLAAE